jgi:hypothetical protein
MDCNQTFGSAIVVLGQLDSDKKPYICPMRSLIIGLVGALFLTASGYAQLSGTYTIGATGNYSNLTAAMNALNSQGINGNVRFEILPDYAGEPSGTATINVAQFGPYAGMGQYNVTLTVHSSVTSPITITTSPSTGLTSRFVFRLTGVDNFTIDGGPNRLLRFTTGAPASTAGIIGLISDNNYHSNPCKRITIRNVEIDGADKAQTRVGIYLGQQSSFPDAANVAGNNDIIIQNCWIYGVQEGIILHGHSSRDRNNQIIGCKIGHPALIASWGGSSRSAGIVVSAQENLLIERDTIFNASNPINYGYTGIAVGYLPQSTVSATPCKNVHIRRNWLYGIAYTGTGGWDAFGIRVHVGSLTNSQTYIYNNLIADIRADGYSAPAGTWNAYGILLDGSSNANAGVYVYHNSIHLYGSVNSSFTNSNPSCLAIRSGITGGVYVRNNIFQNTQTPGPASPTRRTIAVAYQGSSPNVFVELDNNAYYVNNANGSSYIGALGSNVYPTLTAWRGAVGSTREQNSIQLSAGAPFQSNDDLHIPHGTSTPIEGGGALISSPIAITTDFDGDLRPDGSPNPDIGADEFVAVIPPCPTALSADQISASPTSLQVGTGSITLSVNNPTNVTTPAYWLMSVDGGPWNVIAAYTGPSYVYTPSSAGNYAFRLVAIVAPYHSGCPGLQNDSSNIVSVSVVCPTALNADQISVNPTTIVQTQTVTLSVNNPSNVTLPARWEVSTGGASGPWSVLAPYTGPSYTYAPLQGNYWVRLTALPPAGCSNTPVSSNVVSFTVLPPPGRSMNDPIDLTPQTPGRTDTSFSYSTNGYPTGSNRRPMGSLDWGSPAVFHIYRIRTCLDSLRVNLCNNPANGGGSYYDPDLHVYNSRTGCGYRQDGGCSGYVPHILLINNSAAQACNTYITTLSGNPNRQPMSLQAGDTIWIIIQKFGTGSGPVDYVLEITEYPYDHSSAPTLPQPPYFSYDTSRVCWTGAIVRDTFNTGITTPGIQHNWYVNGTQVSGVSGNTFIAQFNAPGVYRVVAELTSAQSSACTPPSQAPRDTVYVLVDSLPATNIQVDGSEYLPGSYASISGSGSSVCVQYSPTIIGAAFTYGWVINGSTYTGPGPHTECYTSSRTDTVVLIVQNGACTEIDTVYVIVDLSTGLRSSWGGLRVYPVPAQEAIYVVWPADGPAHWWIEDLRGQRVYEGEGTLSAGTAYRIPRQNLAAGLYLLRFMQGDRHYLQRIAFE